MADRGAGPRGGVEVLTLAWIAGILGVLWWLWGLAWEGWADQKSGEPLDSVRERTSVALLVLVGVAVGGPLLIALVARRARRTRAGRVYAVMAGGLGLASLPVLVVALRPMTGR